MAISGVVQEFPSQRFNWFLLPRYSCPFVHADVVKLVYTLP